MKNFVVYLIFIFLFSANKVEAQTIPESEGYKKIAAGKEYKRSGLYKFLWGTNYRKEWITPVLLPVLNLDTLKGGILSLEAGGSHQTRSLHIKLADKKEYTLRSVNKSLAIIPDIFKKTFIEHIANDQISMSHPYGALGVAIMAESANLPHTNPKYFYLPEQKSIDTLSKKFADEVYLFEERPKGDWSSADNLDNFNKFINTEKLLENIYKNNNNHVDQLAFVKARLFDMFIGDWDRHLDQWRWGKIEKGKENIYIPIPTDRDQAFVRYNGVLLKTVISAAGMHYLQSFDYKIKDITTLSSERRILDRFFTNQVTLNQWQTLARELIASLPDNVIETSIKQMPPEIFPISGNEIIAKLKSRRDQLEQYASDYYTFLAKEVEIVGSKGSERFEVNRINDNETEVNIYDINKEGETKNKAFYSRIFKNAETKEIRLFGLSGKDIYAINGNANDGIKIRIIGGDEQDSIINNSNIRVHVYDNEPNNYPGSGIKYHLTDTANNTYYYDTYVADKKGLTPLLGYNYEDPFYVGLGYTITHQAWRKFPYAFKQDLGVKYSIAQKNFSVFYNGIFPHAIGEWNLLVGATYDFIRWLNFYGLGNESIRTEFKDIKYNRIQSKQLDGSIGIERQAGKSTFGIGAFYTSTEIIKEDKRYLAKVFSLTYPGVFDKQDYAGAKFDYRFVALNDSIVPTKGFTFFADASHYSHLNNSSGSFEKYKGTVNIYLPLVSKFSLAIRSQAATVTGNPFFYQLPYIGGADDLRGYRRERFFGKTTFTNSNELRFITNFKSYVMNGKIGLSVFYDQGRVWMPSETSNTWHTDYGFGFLLAPFNYALLNVAYGISKEHNEIQLRIIRSIR